MALFLSEKVEFAVVSRPVFWYDTIVSPIPKTIGLIPPPPAPEKEEFIWKKC
jgi:hypothetical protein